MWMFGQNESLNISVEIPIKVITILEVLVSVLPLNLLDLLGCEISESNFLNNCIEEKFLR